MSQLTKIDSWVLDLLVDPLAKTDLVRRDDRFASDYGWSYPLRDGVPDLRLLPGQHYSSDAKTWRAGQDAYERWSRALSRDAKMDYHAELEGVREVYEAIPMVGRCLDVGGHQGRLRAFLRSGQEYLVIDPFHDVFAGLEDQKGLLETYPFLLEPVNFVCAMAEHLPLRSNSFDTVHMRSVIDHLRNPELALLEAFRVLKASGQLVIGLYVKGGRQGRLRLGEVAKEAARSAVSMIGISRYTDHHVWHPTFQELQSLVSAIGFQVDKVHWQSQWVDRVCYLRALKKV